MLYLRVWVLMRALVRGELQVCVDRTPSNQQKSPLGLSPCSIYILECNVQGAAKGERYTIRV